MDWAPSPLPQESSDCPVSKDYTDTVESLVILAVVGMFLLHVLGSLRRRSSNGALHLVVMGVDTMSYPLVGYTIAKMDSSYWYVDDFVVWAVFLLLLLGSTDCLTACRLSDIENWKSTYVKHLFKAFLVVWIVVHIAHMDRGYGPDNDPRYLWAPVLVILFFGFIKSYVRIASMRTVSKSNLCKNVKVIADYMKYKDNPPVSFDPVTMQGYRYLVAGEKHCVSKPSESTPWYKKEDLKITTVEEIWRCTGNLLRHDATANDSPEKAKRVQSLKDLCLSMALSKMLNRRFAGFELSEAELDKTHDLVFRGLLIGNGHQQPHERAFSVIEEELGFVHDLYYTRYYYLYQKGRFYALGLPIIMFGLCSWLTYLLVKHRKESGTSLLSVTIFITAVLAFLEAYQLHLYVASGWFKVALIQCYVSTPCLQTSAGGCLEMVIGLLLRIKAFRPWKNKLGQYCLLRELGRSSRHRNFVHHFTRGLMDKARRKGSNTSVKLSGAVKQAIVASLLGSNGDLSDGVRSLRNNGVHAQLSRVVLDEIACACDDGAVTHTILVWHIATTLCQQLDEQAKDMDTVARLATASTLSQYCMHLLAFAPNLLPDHSSVSEPILDEAINEVDELLKKHKKLDDRCRILMDYSGNDAPLLTRAAKLARHLMNDIQGSTLRWKVLSDFWAEMMLYVSPSDDARSHLEVLAKGGEFITHIWALLTHAGVLKRNRGPTPPQAIV
ncbi:hypothetical protein BS78_05G273800 [Paspalum vaginatum]|nr:hypothetical protein BS78_05G273800 [Paspalum vaginatum]